MRFIIAASIVSLSSAENVVVVGAKTVMSWVVLRVSARRVDCFHQRGRNRSCFRPRSRPGPSRHAGKRALPSAGTARQPRRRACRPPWRCRWPWATRSSVGAHGRFTHRREGRAARAPWCHLLPQAAMPRQEDSAEGNETMQVVRLWFLMRGPSCSGSVDTRGSVCLLSVWSRPQAFGGSSSWSTMTTMECRPWAPGEGSRRSVAWTVALAVCRADGELVSARGGPSRHGPLSPVG